MTLGQSYFDDLYRHHSDPWQFRTRWYESRKRQVTMAALPDLWDERPGKRHEHGL